MGGYSNKKFCCADPTHIIARPMTASPAISDMTLPVDATIAAIRAGNADSGLIIFVSGNFNVIHPGHLRLLRFASDLGTTLVVGLNPDSNSGVTVPVHFRKEALDALTMVHHVVELELSAEEFVRRLQPDIVVKGFEYRNASNPERDIVENYGGKLLFASGEVRFSSQHLLQREYETSGAVGHIEKPAHYRERHGLSHETMRQRMSEIAGLRVLVLGDVIIDEYIDCSPLGMSQEDPTIVVTPLDHHSFLGGAGIVAAHARGLGADVEFVTVTGDDPTADETAKRLENYGVRSHILRDESRPTTLKQRYRAHGKTLLRVSHLRQHAVDAKLTERLIDEIDERLTDVDCLIFSDFNYGCLPQEVVDPVAERARRQGVFLAADSQASSQLSDISRFGGMDLITPTEREARLALGDPNSGLAVLAEELHRKADADNVVITLGAEGMLVNARDGENMQTDRLRAFNNTPRDVAGAGDSFLTLAALCMRAGGNVWEAAYLGSIAAAIQASRIGNTPLGGSEIIEELDRED